MSISQSFPAPNANRTDWAALGWAFLFFWYFSGVYHSLLQISGATIFVGFRQAIIVSTLWLVPLLLFPARTKQIAAVIGVILWAFSLASLGFYFVYQQEFSQSVIFIMFESNSAEASEYVAQYFAWWMIPALLAYTAGAWLLWRRLRPVAMAPNKALALALLILASLFVYPLIKLVKADELSLSSAVEAYEKKMDPATPWQVVFGYTQYRKRLAEMQELLDNNSKVPPLANLRDANAGLPATLVLVIGESTNRQHMGLYGYSRQTTPNLQAMPGVTAFNQVIGARPFTIETLQQTLSFADQKNPDLYLTQPSLMNIMKQAGYKTFWITNQQTLTQRNTMLTFFSQQMDEQVYLNHTRAQNSRSYDTNVLEPFAKVLADPAERKFIIVHLLGTHMKYEYRYPPEYEVFKDRQGLPDWVNDKQLPVINNYDNAVLFNDFVVSRLIKTFQASDPNGFLVYFSDHGEDVFDSGQHTMLGRSELTPSVPMYAVPFLLWTSDSWREKNLRDFVPQPDRPYSLANFIHTWADLAGLRFDLYDPAKSLVGREFKESPLWVGDPYNPKSLIDMRSMMSSGS
ncbi:phosphoethanolamine transferase CptA [Azonexus sp.]|uniref:phosphoethanolamine transferase CptA n=1 Tax=Azonexus sp. TaxID=1872668 RepID=UPI0027BAEBD4|nr:phosphoethanolamine transferase CptA [Azonexus sp.]